MLDPTARPRRGTRCWALAIGLSALGWVFAPPAFGDDLLAVVSREPWSDFFGGEAVDLHFAINAREPFQGRVGWTFAIDRATLARGEIEVQAEPAKGADLAIHLDIPPVKSGVVVHASLTLTARAGGEAKGATILDKPIWVFPRDPFANRTRWLKGLKMTLFDPEKHTADTFEAMKVPFEPVGDVASLSAVTEGMLVIGEGTSFEEYPDLPAAMVKAAIAGRPVLCLAPVAGTLPLPGSEDGPAEAPRGLAFRRREIITELDKWLDAEAWPPDGKVVASSVVLKADEGRVVGAITAEADGWPWVEVDGPRAGGKLVIAGFGIIAHWDSGPAPRFLLARVFERMNESNLDRTENQGKRTEP